MSKLGVKELLLAGTFFMGGEAIADNKTDTRADLDKLNNRVVLAQANTKDAVDSKLTSLQSKKDPNTFNESEFKLDLETYLGVDTLKLFVEMPKDKKNIFANTLTELLRDNGKNVTLTFRNGKQFKVNTVEEIQDIMKSYVYFLHNLDFKHRDTLPLYEGLLSSFQDYRSQGLKVNDKIMYTLYGMKIFAEQADFYRNEILGKPGNPSAKYLGQAKNLKERLAQLEEKNKSLDENIRKLDAEIETLNVVIKALEAMSRVK